MSDQQNVLNAAAALVAAFARNDREAYFAAFSADASFVFYTLPQPLLSRDAYQVLWDQWRAEDGFEVLTCTSSNAFVSLQGDVALFIHDVASQWPCCCRRNTNIYPPCRKGCHPLSQYR